MKKIYPNAVGAATFEGTNNSGFLNKLYLLLIAGIMMAASAMAGNPAITSVVKKSYNGSDISCSSEHDAELTVTASGGTAPYKYSKDNGATYQSGNVFRNLSGGQNYVIKVKDSKNNTSTATWVWVSQAPAPITITSIQKKYYYNGNNDVSCSSASDGEISIYAWGGTGTLQYSLDGVTYQSSNTITGLAAGTYHITVQDANGCTSTSSVTITAPEPVGGTITSQTNIQCSGGNTGAVTVSGSGGVGLYYYSIDGGAFQWSGTFSNLSAGSHQVLVRDHNGCMGSVSVNIVALYGATISGNSTIFTGNSGNFVITINGPVGSTYTAIYKGSNSNLALHANNLKPGDNIISTGILTESTSYTLVTVTNGGGCHGAMTGIANINVVSNCKWLGLNNNWNDANNWAWSMVPTAGYNVVIPATSINPVISNADAMVKNLTLEEGATLTVNGKTLKISGDIKTTSGDVIADNGTIEYNGSEAQTISLNSFRNNAIHDLVINNTSAAGLSLGGSLNIYGSLTFSGTGKKFSTNDFLTLKSTATETARVGDMTGNSFAGKVTVERYIPGTKKAWRFLAVPTQPSQTIHEAWQENQSANSTSLSGNGLQIQGNVADWSAKGFDAYVASPVVKTYNSANDTWTGISSTLVPFSSTAGGYMVFIRGDRTSNAYNSPVTSTILRTKGQLYVGDQQTITVPAKKFIAISNPYAAPLDLRKVDMSSNLFIYVWDPNLGNSYGGYQTLLKNASGNYIAIPGGGSYSHTDNNLIQSGSAFFAFNNNGGNLTIKESSKADVNTDKVAFTPAPALDKARELSVLLYGVDANNNTLMADGILQNFDDSYSNDIDELDAKKSANSTENLSVKEGNQLLVVERKHTMTQNDTTFLNLTGVKLQSYRFEITASNLSADGMQGFIEDNYLHTKTPLNMEGITTYDFTIVNIPAAYATDRFRIEFEPLHALPVTVTSVKANQKGKDISVEWQVENESNMMQYDVERSVDGIRFSKIGAVEAANKVTGTYSLADNSPATGYNYYRIRSIDINGKSTYTQIVKVSVDAIAKSGIAIYPNPVVSGIINLQLTNQPEGIYYVSVTNQIGQPVLSKKIKHNDGNNSESIQLNKTLPHGTYQVEVTKTNGDVEVIKIIY
jgi:hypothetical protein